MNLEQQAALRRLPQLGALLESAGVRNLLETRPRPQVVAALRTALESERERILTGNASMAFEPDVFLASVRERLDAATQSNLRRVVNATGILLHTNLGRAPLADEALQAIQDVAAGYSNLEYDLGAGERGSRYAHVTGLLCELTGAEDALVVNNNAAAVMLLVNTIARGGEVITSRGELIEIGGSFRMPEVIENSDAELVDVGTTNKTRISDFENAITPKTRVLLKVHPSNYRVIGFAESPSREELVALGRRHGIPVVEDLGSGSLVDLGRFGLPSEPAVAEVLRAGVDIVTFSSDKLLGGPQAGVIVGSGALLERMKRNPILRALRVDKLCLAALEATLRLYHDPDSLPEKLPWLVHAGFSTNDLRERASRIVDEIEGSALELGIIETDAYIGGGALPEEAIPSVAVRVRSDAIGPDELRKRLRENDPPVIARIERNAVLLDLRTVLPEELPVLTEALRGILA